MFECFGAFNKYLFPDKVEVYLVVVSVYIICSADTMQLNYSSVVFQLCSYVSANSTEECDVTGAEISTVKRIQYSKKKSLKININSNLEINSDFDHHLTLKYHI